jgi:hypothetical protein
VFYHLYNVCQYVVRYCVLTDVHDEVSKLQLYCRNVLYFCNTLRLCNYYTFKTLRLYNYYTFNTLRLCNYYTFKTLRLYNYYTFNTLRLYNYYTCNTLRLYNYYTSFISSYFANILYDKKLWYATKFCTFSICQTDTLINYMRLHKLP